MQTKEGEVWRAAYVSFPDGSQIVLTGPEHTHLPDDELRSEAHAEAVRMGLITSMGDWPFVTEAQFWAYLTIGIVTKR